MTRLPLLRWAIGLKISRKLFNQCGVKPIPIAPCTRHFSRALNQLHVIWRNLGWFIALLVAVVDGVIITLVLVFRKTFENCSNNSVTLFIQQLLFEGVRGASFTGDIAIDDFKLMDGACNQPAYCDFEKDDWCTWTNSDKEDVFDWLLGSGSTSSVYTGPSNDHTTGVLRHCWWRHTSACNFYSRFDVDFSLEDWLFR